MSAAEEAIRRSKRPGRWAVGGLQRELDDLERSDPAVAAAAKSYDAMRDKIVNDGRKAGGEAATND
jgi:hypothetical protein